MTRKEFSTDFAKGLTKLCKDIERDRPAGDPPFKVILMGGVLSFGKEVNRTIKKRVKAKP